MSLSNLSICLRDMFSKGELAASKVQALAHAAWKDGWAKCELDLKFAHAGAAGSHTGNLNRLGCPLYIGSHTWACYRHYDSNTTCLRAITLRLPSGLGPYVRTHAKPWEVDHGKRGVLPPL